MTLSKAVRSIYQAINLFVVIETDKAERELGFYIKTSINFVVCSNLNVPNLESLCIEIRTPKLKPFLIVTWYRPPCSSMINSFLWRMISWRIRFPWSWIRYYLLDDLNCNLASLQYDSNTRRLCEISDLFGLQQPISEPTRITESSVTLIDLTFTNYPDREVCSGVFHTGIRDHSLIKVYRKLSPALPSKGLSTVSYQNFKNFNRFSRTGLAMALMILIFLWCG